MTQQQLRDLMRERVADETMPDLSAGAWRAGSRARRRRGAVVFAGAAAAVLAVAVVSVAVGRASEPHNVPGQSEASPVPRSKQSDAVYQGLPVWWSPDQFEERSLPSADAAPVPEATGPDVIRAMSATIQGPAVAAFGLDEEVFLLGAEGGALVLDVSSLDKVATENGYRISPLTQAMLSPDGRRLVFPQDGRLVLFDIVAGSWSEVDTGDALTAYVFWLGDEELTLPEGPHGEPGPSFDIDGNPLNRSFFGPADAGIGTGQAQPYGPWRTDGRAAQAQSWGMGVPLPVRPGAFVTEPEFLAAQRGNDHVLLAFMDRRTDGQDARWKQCCPVAGWLDSSTVVYESRQSQPVLVAWTVGTNRFRLVSRIEGTYDVASFAFPGR